MVISTLGNNRLHCLPCADYNRNPKPESRLRFKHSKSATHLNLLKLHVEYPCTEKSFGTTTIHLLCYYSWTFHPLSHRGNFHSFEWEFNARNWLAAIKTPYSEHAFHPKYHNIRAYIREFKHMSRSMANVVICTKKNVCQAKKSTSHECRLVSPSCPPYFTRHTHTHKLLGGISSVSPLFY